ncbi:MAG: hypothetical protein R2813_03370 [Flavobacteriales bacterium]
MTKNDEIDIVHGRGSHLVLLGAGASLAATLRTPEKNGKRLPLMADLVDVVGLNDLLLDLPIEIRSLKTDFEKLYSALVSSGFKEIQDQMEKRVYRYFEEMDLPAEPTLYDYLILSLRHKKDVIATFNWDPFLYKAYIRNAEFTKSPGVLFLHGCVSLGFDKSNGTSGPAGWISKQTLQRLEPTKLLYPVDKKDYSSDPFIDGQWKQLRIEVGRAERVTVFGYSAPSSDVEAIKLLQEAWGSADDRSMEQFELIDVRDEDEVRKTWDTFIHTHHYDYCTTYFDSSLALHPRRTIESYHHWSQPMTVSEAFQEGNIVPDNFRSIEELWKWHEPLIQAEKKFYND